MKPIKQAFVALAALSMLLLAIPPATAIVAQDAVCSPLDGVPVVCATVTLVLFRTTNAACAAEGITVPSGEVCYSITYRIFAQTLIPGIGLHGEASGNHYTVRCDVPVGSLQTTCQGEAAFLMSATPSHCDRVNFGRASNALLTASGADTGLRCA